MTDDDLWYDTWFEWQCGCWQCNGESEAPWYEEYDLDDDEEIYGKAA